MSDIGVRKSLTKFSGQVEYTMDYRNAAMCGHNPDEDHWETESFDSLDKFLNLVGTQFIEHMKDVHVADRVRITNIYLDASNEDGDNAAIWIGKEMRGWSGAKISSEDVESKMKHCVEEIEGHIERIKSTIINHRA